MARLGPTATLHFVDADRRRVIAQAIRLDLQLVPFRDFGETRFALEEQRDDVAAASSGSEAAQCAQAQAVDQSFPHAAQSAGLAGRDA